MHRLFVAAYSISVGTDGIDHILAHAAFLKKLRRFPAVFIRIHLKIDVVQKPADRPVICFIAVSQLVRIPAHHAFHSKRVLDVKCLLVISPQ